MSKATAKNVIQVILQEYLEKNKAMKVAEDVHMAMKSETEHTHNGKKFFINEDENGALVLTMESMVKKKVEVILYQYLKENEVKKFFEKLESGLDIIWGIETIQIYGSDSPIYSELMKHDPTTRRESTFLDYLEIAINAGVKSFKVPVCDMSIDEEGRPCFIPGRKLADDMSYNDLEKFAEENGLILGNKNQYILFLGTIIYRLKSEKCSQEEAFDAICNDPRKLKYYVDSGKKQKDLKLTGSRKIVGKCDIANEFKYLSKTTKVIESYDMAGSCYDYEDEEFSVSGMYDGLDDFEEAGGGVGWFVF